MDVIKKGELSVKDARHSNMRLIQLLEESYPANMWLKGFTATGEQNRSTAQNALRGVLCIVVAGVEISSGVRVHPDSKVSFEDAQNSGMFSMKGSRVFSMGVGIISMPMIAVTLFNSWTGSPPVFMDSELDPFQYGLNEIEDMALAALRCRLNAALF